MITDIVIHSQDWHSFMQFIFFLIDKTQHLLSKKNIQEKKKTELF